MTAPANIRVNISAPFPTNVVGTGGLAVTKQNGIWTITPNFAGLSLLSSVANPGSKEIWIFDPLTGVYNVMTLGGFGQSLFFDTSSTSQTIGAGTFTFTVNPGKGWMAGSFVIIASAANPTVNYMVGQVSSYTTTGGVTSLVVVVANGGQFGSGTHTDWQISLAGGPGPMGPTGPVAGPGTSVDGEIVLWNGTTGALLKRATGTGLAKVTAGVFSVATNGTDYISPSTTTTFTVGYTVTPFNGGTVSSGTFTPAAANGNYQFYTNNGAHTLAVPAADSAIDILVTNGASAGTITFSVSYTVGASTGDPLTTTNTNKFIISIRRINGISTYIVKALQ